MLCWLLLSLFACKTSHNPTPVSQENNVLITRDNVGPIKKGMSVKELKNIFPANRIKKLASWSEVAGTTANNYYVYNDSLNLLFIVSSEHSNDENSRISHIVVKDKTLKTKSGIGLASTVGEIRKAYPKNEFIPSADNIILYIPEIDANFKINSGKLSAATWNDTTGTIHPGHIPAETTVNTLTIAWDYSARNLIEKGFWTDLTHQFTRWVITQVPSMIMLTLIFIALLRLLRFIIKKVKKTAQRRIHLNENIDANEGNKRIETLSGILLGIGNIFLWTIFLLIMLSKFNINIGPLLASAGILGLAVGFGAQELVRDFISGFFILLEDQIRTGDVAIINGTTGTVEKIEMRTTTLRDSSGVVHIFQNGKINTLSNMTKGWSAIVVDIKIAYQEDTDHVNEILKQVGDELLQDNTWGTILTAVDLWGVDGFADSSVILKVKLTTKSGQQWAVSREFRRRVKKAFAAQGIEIPLPQICFTTSSTTPPLPIELKEKK